MQTGYEYLWLRWIDKGTVGGTMMDVEWSGQCGEILLDLFKLHGENCKLYIFGLPSPDEDWFLVFYQSEVSNIFLSTGITVLSPPLSTPNSHPRRQRLC